MAASFPNAKKTFSAVVNGVTKLVAALFNTAYDEIEAMETFVGAMGATQANTDSLKNTLLNFRAGCSVDYKGAADLYVRSGEIAIPDVSGNLRFRKNTSDTTVTWADIDTGAEAGSTIYYVYAVADAAGTTFTIIISTNATTPTGCTFYRLIGTFYNNASSNIEQVANLNRNVSLGNWVDKSSDYGTQLAKTDGFVIVNVVCPSPSGLVTVKTDTSNPPTAIKAKIGAAGTGTNMYGYAMVPVKKDNYWLVEIAGGATITTVDWISLS